jgi:molecular chaperone DnaJ
MSQENYYEILGVDENAKPDVIKKSYRKLAKEHHPDKGGDENKFKKISEAYDILSDDKKRVQYDNQRRNPFGGGGGFNPFEQMFNQQQHRRTVPDKIIDILVGALESFNGSDKHITYQRKHMCGDCNGVGGERITCQYCHGNGFITQRVGTGMFVQMVQSHCNACNAKGYTYRTVCHTCNGETTQSKIETVSIKLPHAVDDGQFLKLQGKGDYHNGIYGNLIVRVKVNPENDFEKFGNDLIYNKYFDLDSLKLESFEVPHPQGQLSIKIPPTFDTSKPLRVKSKGFNGGDLFIKLFVKFTR